jgi:hypothetical protein
MPEISATDDEILSIADNSLDKTEVELVKSSRGDQHSVMMEEEKAFETLDFRLAFMRKIARGVASLFPP